MSSPWLRAWLLAATALLLTGCGPHQPTGEQLASLLPSSAVPVSPPPGSQPESSGPPAPSQAVSAVGARAAWVVAENAKPGDPSWRIAPGLAGPLIAGYADTTQAQAGQVVRLFVSTAAPTFTVAAYRMGYYGGTDARLVWSSAPVRGQQQPACPVTTGINMVECLWSESTTVTITSAWPQGDYLLKLIATGGQQSYIPLTVADPSSHAAYLVQNSDMSWQAWNTYGGYDLDGGAASGNAITFADRARVVSFDRPYATGAGAGDFLGYELPLVEFVEQHGLDVTYASDVALNDEPGLMQHHKVFLSLGHDDCWALHQRAGIAAAIRHGLNAVFFGAGPILRHVRMQAGPLGPDGEMVDYRDAQQDPLYRTNPKDATGDTWADPPAAAPASEITGDTYAGSGVTAPLVISDAAAWLFAGTGLHNGSALPRVVQGDYDHVVPGQAGPSDVQILASSPVTTPDGLHAVADMTYYMDPASKAGVIATGTDFWIGSLPNCPATTSGCVGPTIQQITINILAVVGAEPAGRIYRSVPSP